ncbi:MAG: hypothetical protein SGJ11_17395 [Phycisphaerae bacterium]|nr:hypothetical protein [Phycisphaerae bacterium]
MSSEVTQGEDLRRLGVECAAMILRNPQAWSAAVNWLVALPFDYEIVERRRSVAEHSAANGLVEPVAEVELPLVWHLWPGGPADLEHADVEHLQSRRLGPIARRILTAWDAAVHRFADPSRSGDAHYDFGLR